MKEKKHKYEATVKQFAVQYDLARPGSNAIL